MASSPGNPNVFNNVNFGQPDSSLTIPENPRYIDPNLFGQGQLGTPGYIGGQQDAVGKWMAKVAAPQPSLGPVDPNAMGGQQGPGQGPIGSMVAPQAQGGQS